MNHIALTPDATKAAPQAANQATATHLGHAATAALLDELALYPKPGLVSFVDTGSHADMNAATFQRSLAALGPSFVRMALLGAEVVPFAALERCGIAAEQRMLVATGGVNTHRGAIFTLGLLCAAAGRQMDTGRGLDVDGLRAGLRRTWGAALAARCQRGGTSNGQQVARRHGLRGAGSEAAEGFPALFEVGWPTLVAATVAGLDPQSARLQTLFALIAVLDDTTLVHRGGLQGLRFAQRAARAFLAAGGAARPDALAEAVSIHRAFVARRLSPGGAADLLAAACWLQRIGMSVPDRFASNADVTSEHLHQ